jgi:hypothetical protein
MNALMSFVHAERLVRDRAGCELRRGGLESSAVRSLHQSTPGGPGITSRLRGGGFASTHSDHDQALDRWERRLRERSLA